MEIIFLLDVCFIRLDFDIFQIQGPVNEENGGSCELDSFQVQTSNEFQLIPIICGDNSGQHGKNCHFNIITLHIRISFFQFILILILLHLKLRLF